MNENTNFLCELGTEEIPAGYIPPAINYIKGEFAGKLREYRLDFDDIEVLATPRKIAVLINKLAEFQSENDIELKGPSLNAAYDGNNNPTKALQGFLKGNDLSKEDLFTKRTEKGEYIYALKKGDKKNTEIIIPDILDHIIRTTPFPKKMKWSNKKLLFPRPIAYILILFNDRIVPYENSGIQSSNKTRGHYIRFNEMIEVNSINDYIKILRKNDIYLDQNERKESIRKELMQATEEIDGTIVMDEELLDTVTYLTESPHVLICRFDDEFLEIPDIVLITEMKEHQKYFAVNDKNGNLLPYFLVVSNNPPTDKIKIGNVKVITARFNDARFFFTEDRKTRLIDKIDSLKSVLFQKELGTIYDKVERIRYTAGRLAGLLGYDEGIKNKIDRAVSLCKADLNTHMVFEFTSLQGKIGKIYALLDGEDEEVAAAIDDHYKPRFQDDPLPTSQVGIVVSLSEKIDNLFGSYSIGNIPKGSQDPYALRRQAHAIIQMLLDSEISIDMKEVLQSCAVKYKNGPELIGPILDFLSGRAKTILQEHGFSYDEIDACLSIRFYNYLEIYRRAKSLHEFRKNTAFTEMLLCFKRMNNIVSAFRKKEPDTVISFSEQTLEEKEEKNLFTFFNERRESMEQHIVSNDYESLFYMLIEGKSIIDSFFDSVLVMSDDMAIRNNRIAMLEKILGPFKNLLDFSKISE